jgi:hypothetical protein
MQAISLRTRIYFTAIITLAMWSLLAWNYFHGGVPSHHLLAQENLPSVSNGWGALLLPLLTWFLLYRTSRRTTQTHEKAGSQLNVWIVFGASLLFGIMLSTFFTYEVPELSSYMLFSVFILALFFPVYRAECLLGFVIGMTYTFGAVLPTFIGSILAIVGAIIYLLIRPAILFVASKFTQMATLNKNITK